MAKLCVWLSLARAQARMASRSRLDFLTREFNSIFLHDIFDIDFFQAQHRILLRQRSPHALFPIRLQQFLRVAVEPEILGLATRSFGPALLQAPFELRKLGVARRQLSRAIAEF